MKHWRSYAEEVQVGIEILRKIAFPGEDNETLSEFYDFWKAAGLGKKPRDAEACEVVAREGDSYCDVCAGRTSVGYNYCPHCGAAFVDVIQLNEYLVELAQDGMNLANKKEETE